MSFLNMKILLFCFSAFYSLPGDDSHNLGRELIPLGYFPKYFPFLSFQQQMKERESSKPSGQRMPVFRWGVI